MICILSNVIWLTFIHRPEKAVFFRRNPSGVEAGCKAQSDAVSGRGDL